MRLWTVHPKYLDAKGLVAAWREALLAQKVLTGNTKGYRRHPQLVRFRACSKPAAAIASFLLALAEEADRRGYQFDRDKILHKGVSKPIEETDGQLAYEWIHLKRKLRERSPKLYREFCKVKMPESHPLFQIIAGGIKDWERR
jgi:hypothetical protein